MMKIKMERKISLKGQEMKMFKRKRFLKIKKRVMKKML